MTGDALDFDKSKWIKQNRKYPADPPAELRASWNTISYEIPQKSTSAYARANRIFDAKSAFGQASLDGAKSIDDPHYKGGFLLLWTVD